MGWCSTMGWAEVVAIPNWPLHVVVLVIVLVLFLHRPIHELIARTRGVKSSSAKLSVDLGRRSGNPAPLASSRQCAHLRQDGQTRILTMKTGA
jgi:hypothetical protein